ncbi:MAG: SprT family zinc-dependent metalloprotease [Acidobacteriota bacterium]
MQLDLPFLRGIPAPPEPRPDEPPAVEFVRTRRARRYILRIRPDGGLRVTIPRGGSRAEAVRFVERQAAWVQRQRARLRSVEVAPKWTDGAGILLRGERVMIQVTATNGHRMAHYGGRSVRVPADAVDLRTAIEPDLRGLAREELVPRLYALAAEQGVAVTRCTIRNQRSRWGSCSRSGAIALNYRLVQMPRAVSDYVLLHELMHLKQPNHSRRFWRLVEHICPEFRAAEQWLKDVGRTLL